MFRKKPRDHSVFKWAAERLDPRIHEDDRGR